MTWSQESDQSSSYLNNLIVILNRSGLFLLVPFPLSTQKTFIKDVQEIGTEDESCE